MLYSLIKILLLRPTLLAQHFANYADAFRHEMQAGARQWAVKLVAGLVCGVCVLITLVLAGVAVMVGVLQNQFHWALVLVPLVPLAMALIALGLALRKVDHAPFALMREQFAADMAMFTGNGSPAPEAPGNNLSRVPSPAANQGE
ncbi:MAG: hypothetical protein Q4G39_08235 [Brachymonas sp.]|nr:hypothetical protein [Brachymonas sp.]